MKHVIFVSLFGPLGISAALWAAEDPKPCNLMTMKGDWGIVVNGLTRPSAPNGPLEAFAGSLLRRFDGVGGFTQVDNIHGALSGHVPDRPGRGTYIVNADCTAVTKLEITGVPFQPEERFVIVEDGNAVFSVTTFPLTVLATNQGRRINSVNSQAQANQADMVAQLLRLVNAIAFRMGLAPAASN